MTLKHTTWLLAGLALGCGGKDGTGPADTGGTTGPDPLPTPSVMRDCPADVGNVCPWAGAGVNGFNGDAVDRLDAWFSFPMSVHFSDYGPPTLADWNNHKIRQVLDNPEDGFQTIMGTDFLGDGDAEKKDLTDEGAPGTAVSLNHPTQHVYLSDGTLVSASWHTHKIRTWDPATGLVHVQLGGPAGFSGNEEESADEVIFNQPVQVILDSLENYYVLDMRNQRIRYVDLDAWTVSTIAGHGEKGYCGDGGSALDACFNFPQNANPEPGGGLALTSDDQWMYVADSESHVIRLIDLAKGTIELIAGTPEVSGSQDGAGLSASFHYPAGLALDEAAGVLFIADANNHKIRALDLATHEVTTFAGTGEPSCEISTSIIVPEICAGQSEGGDGGPATAATFYRPFGVSLTPEGDLVVADTYNHRFRIIYR